MNSLTEWSNIIERMGNETRAKQDCAREILLEVEKEYPFDEKDLQLMDLVNDVQSLSRVPLYTGITPDQQSSYKEQLIATRLKLKSYNC